MRKSRLSAELISLVHHIELNKAGWWDKAIEQFFVATIWLSGGSLTRAEIINELRQNFGINLSADRLDKHIDSLCRSQTLILLGKGQLRLSENTLKRLEGEIKSTESIQTEAKAMFVRILEDTCPSVDTEQTWKSFIDGFLLPFVHEMGAKMYEVVSGINVNLDTTAFTDFLHNYPQSNHQPLRNAILAYLDPQNTIVRTYILRHLNSYFLLEAGNLSEETLAKLADLTRSRPSFTVFLDTNFLFSMLGITQDSFHTMAQTLKDLRKGLSDQISLDLYILPSTMDEAKRVLNFQREKLSGLRLTHNLADVALENGLNVFVRWFAQESRAAGRPLKVDDFFAPYLNNLTQILKSNGIELWNENIDKYKHGDEVLDDISDQLEREKQRSSREAAHRKKTYDLWEHDVVLWHFVRSKRPIRVESLLDARYWVVTVDNKLLKFDAFKRGAELSSIPVCVRPTALIQLLQFWIPRSPQLDEAILDSLRWPFLFPEFDTDAEKVTIRILETLSRFENVDYLPNETVKRILVNDALREKLSVHLKDDAQLALVREVLIEENQRIGKDLGASSMVAKRLEREMKEKGQQIKNLEKERDKHVRHYEESENLLNEEVRLRHAFEGRVADLEKKLEEKERKDRAAIEIRQFLLKSIALGLSLILGGVFLSYPLASATLWRLWKIMIVIESGSILLWVLITNWYGSKSQVVQEWSVFISFQLIRKLLFGGLILGALGSILGNAVWEWLKSIKT